MQMLSRLLRHATATKATARRLFPAATLQAITEIIRQGEQLHRAEIKLIIETSLSTQNILRKLSARDRARGLFLEHKVWDTEDNGGVLVYVNLADRKVEIVADRGVDRCLTKTEWHAVCKIITDGFAAGIFHDSVIAALVELNDRLQSALPAAGKSENILGDTPLLL